VKQLCEIVVKTASKLLPSGGAALNFFPKAATLQDNYKKLFS